MSIEEKTFFTRSEEVLAINGVIIIKFSNDFKMRKAKTLMRKTGFKLYPMNSLLKANIKHVLITPTTYSKLLKYYGELAEKYIGGVDLKQLNKFYNMINPQDLKSSLQAKHPYIKYFGKAKLYSKEYFMVVNEVFTRHNISADFDSTTNKIIFPDKAEGVDRGYWFMKLVKLYREPIEFYKYEGKHYDKIPIRVYPNLGKYNKDKVIFIDSWDTLKKAVEEYGAWFGVAYSFMNTRITFNKEAHIKKYKPLLMKVV